MKKSTLTKENTIGEAKAFLKEHFEDGSICPCCGQIVKLYNRKLNSVMSRMLIKLSHLPEGFNHVSKIQESISTTGTNDFSKLLHWNMVEQQSNEDPARKTSGNWRITQKGKDFVNMKISVPKYCKIYNTKKLGMSLDQISISESLGNKFNYQKLMNNES